MKKSINLNRYYRYYQVKIYNFVKRNIVYFFDLKAEIKLLKKYWSYALLDDLAGILLFGIIEILFYGLISSQSRILNIKFLFNKN